VFWINSGILTYFGCDFIGVEYRDGSTVSNTGGCLQNVTVYFDKLFVNSSPIVKMKPGKIQFPHIPSVVHMFEKNVNVLCRAYTYTKIILAN